MKVFKEVRDVLPGQMVVALEGLPDIRYKYHPYIEQAIFRSIQEIHDRYPEALDLAGEKFGKLRVTGYAGLVSHADNNTGVIEWFDKWNVQCDCGKPEKAVGGNHLRTGNTRSCGCARGRHGKRDDQYYFQFPVRFESWKNPTRFERVK